MGREFMEASKRKSYAEYLVAGSAAFVSLTTLIVLIYQTKLMNQQQHLSAWPYLEWLSSDVTDFHLTVRNKGVGPAIVRKVEMRVDGKTVAGNVALVRAVLGPGREVDWINSTIAGRVLSPGEEVIPFQIADLKTGRDFEAKLRAHHFEMEISYCSVYGDCWESSGTTVKPLPRAE
jgi:hypothetical protein